MKLTRSLTVAALALGSVIGLSNMAAASPLAAASGDAARTATPSDLIVQVQGGAKTKKSGGGGAAANGGGGNRNAGGGNRGGNRNAGGGGGGNRHFSGGGHRGHGGRTAAGIAAGVGLVGGLIAIEAARQNGPVGVYEDDEEVYYEQPRCPYGSYIGRDGYRHCRR
jgi:hypothetical protein